MISLLWFNKTCIMQRVIGHNRVLLDQYVQKIFQSQKKTNKTRQQILRVFGLSCLFCAWNYEKKDKKKTVTGQN